MVLTQKEMSELYDEMECENKEAEQRECMMQDIDCFMESDVVADAVAKLKEVKELCKMYGHDFSEVVDGMKDIIV